jgi:Protein of unknown function (DUF1565)
LRGSIRLRPRAALATGASVLVVVGAALTGFPAIASGASAGSEYVSKSGSDTGKCTKRSPCKTINNAISRATPGETIHVEKGTYHQTVNVTKPVTILGAGASSTTLNGAGRDPSGQGYYGVVYVGSAGGPVTVSGLTITNPYPYSYTGGEPEAVALADPNSSDTIKIVDDKLKEGNADHQASSDFPIGIDTFLNAATTLISGDSISGFFQGALLEDNGPATVSNDKFTSLISGTDNSTSPATKYPAEGVFFLADEGGTYRGQNAERNMFLGYTGYGVAESAGYTGGYVTPGCVAHGSIRTRVSRNTFELTGGSKAAAISLKANGTGNNLAGSVSDNVGYVTSPSKGIETRSTAIPPTPQGTDCTPYGTSNGGGGTVEVTTNQNLIKVKPASHSSAASNSPAASWERSGGLHLPRLPDRRAR